MFCAGCGSPIQSGLNYCSRCGRRVADDSHASQKTPRSNPLVIAGNTAGFGFLAFIFVVLILTKSAAMDKLPIIAFFYFAALFGICFGIIRHGLPGERSEALPARDQSSTPPSYLKPVITAQLEESRDMGIGSVTDATTRTLDELKVDRK